MHRLPGRDAQIGRRVPVGGQLVRAEQADFPPRRSDDARALHSVHARVLALGELFGATEVALRETTLFEPGDGPAAVGVEVALLLGQRLVDSRVWLMSASASRTVRGLPSASSTFA
jgi:hypothetical protein